MKESETAVNELLNYKDVDVNLKDNDNQTALHFAAKWVDIPNDFLEIIVEKSTDVNAQDKGGHTVLHVAIMGKSETAIKELVKRNDVDVNLKNNQNQTALHLTSVMKDIPIYLFRIILEKSTDVNAQDENGNTALHWAIMSKSEIATNQLLNYNDADVTIKNHKNQTAFDLCSESKDIPAHLFKIISDKTAAAADTQAQKEVK
jgi:E3 ubiquitin-protein ligase mind-bomb